MPMIYKDNALKCSNKQRQMVSWNKTLYMKGCEEMHTMRNKDTVVVFKYELILQKSSEFVSTMAPRNIDLFL